MAPASTTHAAVSSPFKGSLTGQYGDPAGQFPLIDEIIRGDGHATHLGNYTFQISETVDLANATATGQFVFTAANGDQVTGTFTGTAQPGAVVSIEEQASITGGTGRFEGAGGQFTINREFDVVSRRTRGSFDGSLLLPRH